MNGRHLPAALVFAAATAVLALHILPHFGTSLPGSGDNLDFLWNDWWMRVALREGLDFFHTAYLFVPVGSDLTLHTHTALPAFVGATVLAPLSIASALNTTVLAALFLNSFCAYFLALRITQNRGASICGGLVFGMSPFIAMHLSHGHFNLTNAWPLPLFALACSRMIDQRSSGWAMLAGLVLGLTSYIDYYFVVYELMLGAIVVLLAWRTLTVTRQPIAGSRRLAARIVAAFIVLDIALIATVLVTGGAIVRVGQIQVSLQAVFNPIEWLWALSALWTWLTLGVKFQWRRSPSGPSLVSARSVALGVSVFVLTASPLLYKAAMLVARGDYVTQRYKWRSAPQGVDLLTLLLGNPASPLTGDWVQRRYSAIGIDGAENAAWLGVVPLILAVVVITRRWSEPQVRRWTAIGAVFFVCGLGPYLVIGGNNTGLMLPDTLIRYIPILSNARIPGRAMVVVYLAISVLVAVGVASWRLQKPRPMSVWVGLALILIDWMPAPVAGRPLDHFAIYDDLRPFDRGAVCELPLGIRDGLSAVGTFDDQVMVNQTFHERPVVGGYVSRLLPSVRSFYEHDPLLSSLMKLSTSGISEIPAGTPDRRTLGPMLAADGISYVVLNRPLASKALAEYVDRVMPLTLIASSDGRELYRVERR